MKTKFLFLVLITIFSASLLNAQNKVYNSCKGQNAVYE